MGLLCVHPGGHEFRILATLHCWNQVGPGGSLATQPAWNSEPQVQRETRPQNIRWEWGSDTDWHDMLVSEDKLWESILSLHHVSSAMLGIRLISEHLYWAISWGLWVWGVWKKKRVCVCQCASACLCFCVYVWEYVWMCLCVSVCESIVCMCVSICVAERVYVSVSACKTMCQCVCVWERYMCVCKPVLILIPKSTGFIMCSNLLIEHWWTGEMIQKLKKLPVFAEDLSLLPRAASGGSQPWVIPTSGDLMPFSGLREHLHSQVYTRM